MNATELNFANILQTLGNINLYHVPKYQREYTWGRNEWEQLLEDIDENETGYFMGSIICIADTGELAPGESLVFEVVDGQQRLITLSTIIMAIYYKLKKLETTISSEDEEEQDEYRVFLNNIRKQLIYRKESVHPHESGYFKDKRNKRKYCFLRVQPSTQNHNL